MSDKKKTLQDQQADVVDKAAAEVTPKEKVIASKKAGIDANDRLMGELIEEDDGSGKYSFIPHHLRKPKTTLIIDGVDMSAELKPYDSVADMPFVAHRYGATKKQLGYFHDVYGQIIMEENCSLTLGYSAAETKDSRIYMPIRSDNAKNNTLSLGDNAQAVIRFTGGVVSIKGASVKVDSIRDSTIYKNRSPESFNYGRHFDVEANTLSGSSLIDTLIAAQGRVDITDTRLNSSHVCGKEISLNKVTGYEVKLDIGEVRINKAHLQSVVIDGFPTIYVSSPNGKRHRFVNVSLHGYNDEGGYIGGDLNIVLSSSFDMFNINVGGGTIGVCRIAGEGPTFAVIGEDRKITVNADDTQSTIPNKVRELLFPKIKNPAQPLQGLTPFSLNAGEMPFGIGPSSSNPMAESIVKMVSDTLLSRISIVKMIDTANSYS